MCRGGVGWEFSPRRKYSDAVVESSDSPSPEAAERLLDLLYTGVGLGILAINRFQVARRGFEQRFAESDAPVPGLDGIQELLADPERTDRLMQRIRVELQDLDDRLDGFENRLSALLDGLEPELPDGARELSRALRIIANDHAAELRTLLGLEAR